MAESNKSAAGRAFAPFEWMIALRYLRAKRQESFVSVISGFSLVGIALGVATLIIVMSVMGGFRNQFIQSLLGFNGHVTVQAVGEPLVASITGTLPMLWLFSMTRTSGSGLLTATPGSLV